MALFRPNPSGSGGGGTTDTGSLLITASYTFPDLTFTKGDGSTFSLNVSTSLEIRDEGNFITSSPTFLNFSGSGVTASASGSGVNILIEGGDAVLLQNLTTNVTVGGSDLGTFYPSGTLLEDILIDILTDTFPAEIDFQGLLFDPPVGPTVGVMGPTATREVSHSLGPFNIADYSASPRNPGGNYPISASFTASGADSGDFNFYMTNGPLVGSNQSPLGANRTVNMTGPGPVTFTINAIEPVDLTGISTQGTLTYIYPTYYGMVATDFSTSGNIDGNLTKLLLPKGNRTVPMNGTNAFIYFAYPATYGNLISIKDQNQFEYLNNAIPSFTPYTRTQSGSYEWSTNYIIYKYTANLPNGTNANQNFTFAFT